MEDIEHLLAVEKGRLPAQETTVIYLWSAQISSSTKNCLRMTFMFSWGKKNIYTEWDIEYPIEIVASFVENV